MTLVQPAGPCSRLLDDPQRRKDDWRMRRDTIFALSSGAGRAGVAVIRISGSDAGAALEAMCGPLPVERKAALRAIRDPSTGEAIDRGLALWFPAGRSFTGEPSAELQMHGGRAVVAAALAALERMDGLRLAGPGEFTRRAFENGRLDLAQVEALDDLIAADTAAQRRQALRGISGELGRIVAGWRDQLLAARSLLAAEIDFADEGDVGEEAAAGIDSLLLRLRGEVERVLASSDAGRIVAGGYRIAILGRPNSGKSSLLNALAGTDAAIVSEMPGTTRDVIEVRLDWDGFEVVLADTAGIRESADPVERIGMERAAARAADADLRLVLDETADWSVLDGFDSDADSIRVRTKLDLARPADGISDADVSLSVVSGAGLTELRTAIVARARAAAPSEDVLIARRRQRDALASAKEALDRALALGPKHVELRDHEIRSAEAALDALVGRTGVEEVLGAVFARFCIGK
jgi:tRNA modification GTPase